MSMDCGETVTSRRGYKYEEDGRGPGRWGSVAPNRLGSETVFPFAHAGENLLGSHSLLIWMVSRQPLRLDYFTFVRQLGAIAGWHFSVPSSRDLPSRLLCRNHRSQPPATPHTLLENSRPSRPSSDVPLQKSGELFSNWWQFPARLSNLTKVEVHHRIDQAAGHKSSILTLRKREGRNDRNPLPGPHHRDLRIEIIQNQTRLIHDAGFCEIPINKLLQRQGGLQRDDLLTLECRPCDRASTGCMTRLRSYDHHGKAKQRYLPDAG